MSQNFSATDLVLFRKVIEGGVNQLITDLQVLNCTLIKEVVNDLKNEIDESIGNFNNRFLFIHMRLLKLCDKLESVTADARQFYQGTVEGESKCVHEPLCDYFKDV